MKVMVRAEKGVFYPGDDEAADWMMKKHGTFSAEVKGARNPQFHNYVFKMFHIMFDMVDTTLGFTPWRRLLMVDAGYFDVSTHEKDGKTISIYVPHSLSFENMEPEDFRTCWLTIHQAFANRYDRSLTEDQLNEWAMM